MIKTAATSILKNDILIDEEGFNYKECDIFSEDNTLLETIWVYEKNGEFDMQATLNAMGLVFGTSAWVIPE